MRGAAEDLLLVAAALVDVQVLGPLVRELHDRIVPAIKLTEEVRGLAPAPSLLFPAQLAGARTSVGVCRVVRIPTRRATWLGSAGVTPPGRRLIQCN